MAEEFNRYFTSAFTSEDMANIPATKWLFRGREENKLLDIHIDEDLVRRKLDSFRTDKSPGADNISSRALIELQDEIVYLTWPHNEMFACIRCCSR